MIKLKEGRRRRRLIGAQTHFYTNTQEVTRIYVLATAAAAVDAAAQNFLSYGMLHNNELRWNVH
jgi:hypothetical protein